MTNKSFRPVIIAIFSVWFLCPRPLQAQGSANVMVVERHVGGDTVYLLRNSGNMGVVVTVAYTDLASGQRIRNVVFAPPMGASADVTTAQASTKPVIMSAK